MPVIFCIGRGGVKRGGICRRGVFLVVAAAMVVASGGCSSVTVTLVNESGMALRLSGCYIDESVDLQPGDRDDTAASGRWGCDVYAYPVPLNGRYLGCLVLDGHRRVYSLLRDIDTLKTEKSCDSI